MAPQMDTSTADQKPRGVLHSINYATVVSSALAAGTSLILSSRIGIAGSLIGTIVAAGVSSASLQIYQHLISRSTERLQHTAIRVRNSTTKSPSEDMSETGVIGAGETAVQQRPLPSLDDTEPHGQIATGTPIAPDAIRMAAHERHAQIIRRRSLVVAIVAALVALGITAAVIMAATAGEGLGSKTTFTSPESLVQPSSEPNASREDERTSSTSHEHDSGSDTSETTDTPTTDTSETVQPSDTDATTDAPTTPNNTDGETTTDTRTNTNTSSTDTTDSSNGASSPDTSATTTNTDGTETTTTTGDNGATSSKTNNSKTNNTAGTGTSSTKDSSASTATGN